MSFRRYLVIVFRFVIWIVCFDTRGNRRLFGSGLDNEKNRGPELLIEKNDMVPTETSQPQSKVRRTKIRVRNIGTAKKKICSKYSGRAAIATNKQRQSPDVDSKLGGNPVSSWNQGTTGTKDKVSKQTGRKSDFCQNADNRPIT